MNKQYQFSELQEKVAAVNKVIVVLPANPNFDEVSSGLSLLLSLKDNGKNVSVVCPSPMTVEFNRLVGVDQVSPKAKGNDFVINVDFLMEQIEKVSYNDEGGKLNLVIQPKIGTPELSEKSVTFSSTGVNADLILSVGIRDIGQISGIIDGDLATTNIIDIDNDPRNPQFGNINIIDLEASSISEMVLGIILGLNLSLTTDIAQNILSGIWKNTHGLIGAEIGADTYESVAICLRNGAKKPLEVAGPKSAEQFKLKPRIWTQPPQLHKEETKPLEKTPDEEPPNPPADWFEPKIYKGTNIA